MSPPPSTALQARINAFEALNRPETSPPTGRRPASPPNILERPISPPLSAFSPITPSAPSSPTKFAQPSFTTCSPSPSPPNLGRRTSLIDLKDWVLDDGASTHTNGTGAPSSPHLAPNSKFPSPPLINLDTNSPPNQCKIAAPPLPPRKPSYSSLQSVSANSSTSSLARSPGASSTPLQVPAPLPPPRKISGTHTYPPASTLGIIVPRGHAPASSISSFHSVSLSDGDPAHREQDSPLVDTDDFEQISAAPTSLSIARPPRLPQRPPSTKPASAPPSRTPSGMHTPKPPPPPPPVRSRQVSARASPSPSTSASTSDRSSIRSSSTAASSYSHSHPLAQSKLPVRENAGPASKLARPAPVPPAARRRYEALFAANLRAQRALPRMQSPPPGAARKRQAAGWRGLSVDLITSPELSEKGKVPEEDDRLAGVVVRSIWTLSRLDRGALRTIWTECDPEGRGSLDCAAFVKGMWRIDEELRRAQLVGLSRHASTASARSPPRLPSRTTSSSASRSNLILR